jgi:N-acetylglucosamine-6-phosphate deacetylase
MTQAVRSASAEARRPAAPWAAPLLITNVYIPGYLGRKRLWVTSSGEIAAVEPMEQSFDRQPQPGLKVIDLQNSWLSIGGVDLQINGALGLAFTDLIPDQIPDPGAGTQDPTQTTPGCSERLAEICRYLWREGVDAFLPTLVTTSISQVQAALAVIADYCKRPSEDDAAKIMGVHLEGPCLAPAKRGAHPQEHLQPLTPEAMAEVLGNYGHIVKMVTLAPELDPSGAVIKMLLDRGIAVSLGHSQATAEEAQLAFERGATLVTHAFNAMPGLHHREPGLLGAALGRPVAAADAAIDRPALGPTSGPALGPASGMGRREVQTARPEKTVRCGFIADGEHISPLMLELLWRMGGKDRLFLVSDALAPLGLPDGTYPWDSREITVTQGTARLADGTLSGTTRSLLVGVKNLVEWGICSVEEGICLATCAPRQAIGELQTTSSDSRRAPQYVGRSIHQLLQWTWSKENNALSWKRFSPAEAFSPAQE